jgi:hypothetical protein
MANQEKGLNRGGVLGQEGELGEESKDLERKHTERSQLDRRSQQRESPPDRRGEPPGGLRREPDLEGAEKKTGHEVD